VADANVLFQDTQRYLKDGFTALTFLARHDVITLLTSEHVRRRIPEIIDEKSRSPAQLHRVWRRVYLPLIRLVAVPKSMCAGHPQIDAIADPDKTSGSDIEGGALADTMASAEPSVPKLSRAVDNLAERAEKLPALLRARIIAPNTRRV